MNDFIPTLDQLENVMARGTFRLKSRELMEKYGGDKTLYRVGKDGDVNYSTILRWINEPEKVKGIQGDVLFSFLIGLGLNLEEINDLPLGEIFDFEPDQEFVAQ